MPLPNGLPTVTVTIGPYVTADGAPASGTVTFQPEGRAVHSPSGAVILGAPMPVTLDGSGAGTITLPASDAPGLTPNPLGYWVFWRLNGAPSPDPLRVLLPAAAPTVDLDLLLPSSTPAGPVAQPAVTSVAGLTGAPSAAGLLSALGLFVPPNPQSGQYMLPIAPSSTNSSPSLGNGTVRAMPWMLQRPLSINRIGAEIVTAGQAGSLLRLGIYADDGTGRPGPLMIDAGTVPGDAIAAAVEVPCVVTLPVGIVWLAAVVQNAPATQPSVRTAVNVTAPFLLPLGTLLPTASATAVGAAHNGAVQGALPAQFVWSFASGAAARLFVRAA
jgi:hypothetical protein